jgi:inosine triphosphate pyrophosphatase
MDLDYLVNMTLYFITGNQGKLKEVQAILPNVESIDLDLPEVQSLNPEEVISEKLKEATKKHDGEFFVEDTSIYIDCLNGFPGPLIKWFSESLGNEGIYDLVSKYENTNCTAKTVIGYFNGKEIKFFSGELKGKIVAPSGTGFGWDPIFMPEGYDKTLGEFSLEEKNQISMRNVALMKLKEFLDK